MTKHSLMRAICLYLMDTQWKRAVAIPGNVIPASPLGMFCGCLVTAAVAHQVRLAGIPQGLPAQWVVPVLRACQVYSGLPGLFGRAGCAG